MTRTSSESHYAFLDQNYNTVLTRMGKADLIPRRGNFSADGDKYHQYKEIWKEHGIPYNHGAVLYHLMGLLYADEVRNTPNGWIAPHQWVINNYASGHNLSRYLQDLT